MAYLEVESSDRRGEDDWIMACLMRYHAGRDRLEDRARWEVLRWLT